MGLSINTNVMSLNAQRNLGNSQNALSKSMQRLSSGLRINSAKDDAAGLAISDRMTSQIRGLNQAARNANDGISLAQTAEGALQETTNILQRMRELAVQSANDTNTTSDRNSLQDEVDQLISEMDRIAQTTSFNGKRVIDGSMTDASFHVGANSGQTISFSISSASASAIGGIAELEGAAVSNAAATDITISLDGGKTSTSIDSSAGFAVTGDTQRDSTSAFAKAAAINSAGIGGLTATAETEGTSAAHGASTVSSATTGDAYQLSINGTSIVNQDVSTSGTAVSLSELVGLINAESSDTGVVATLGGTANDEITLTASDGRDILVAEGGDVTGVVGDGSFAANLKGKITLSATDTITIGGTTATIGHGTAITKDTLGIDDVDISTREGADTAIKRVDSALSAVDTIRGGLGAIQNRFESTISNLNNVSENLSAARSRILDADIAQETSAMTKNNILQQAGVSILAQANQAPQLALSLLG